MRPFLKWAGNKYQIVARIKAELPPGKRLIEPFVGSGALFLNTDFPRYWLTDANGDLIQLYQHLQREGDEFIECRASVAEQFARAFVALEHELAELGEVAGVQRPRGGDDAPGFGDDVAGALELAFGEVVLPGFEKRGVGGAQGFKSEDARGGFKFRAQPGNRFLDPGVSNAGVAEHPGDFAVERDEFDSVGLHVEFDGVECFPEQGGDGGGQAGVARSGGIAGEEAGPCDLEFFNGTEGRKRGVMSRALGRRGDAGDGECVRMQLPNGERGGDQQRVRTAEAGAGGNRAVNGGAESAAVRLALAERIEHGLDGAGDDGAGRGVGIEDGEYFWRVLAGRNDFHLAIGACRDGDGDGAIHRHGEREAVIQVGVAAEQFDDAGSLNGVGRREAELASKELLRRGHQRGDGLQRRLTAGRFGRGGIEFRRQCEIFFGQTAFIVRGQAEGDFVPADVDVRVVPGFLGSFGDGVHEADGGGKILELKCPADDLTAAPPVGNVSHRFGSLFLG